MCLPPKSSTDYVNKYTTAQDMIDVVKIKISQCNFNFLKQENKASH